MYFATNPPKRCASLGDALLIGGNHLTQILRVHACRQRCRADQVREHHGDLAALGGVLNLRLRRMLPTPEATARSPMASKRRIRWPSEVTPSSFRLASVSFVRRAKSMSFSANRLAYCPSPSFSSQSATCCIAAAPRIAGLRPPAGATLSEKPATQ